MHCCCAVAPRSPSNLWEKHPCCFDSAFLSDCRETTWLLVVSFSTADHTLVSSFAHCLTIASQTCATTTVPKAVLSTLIYTTPPFFRHSWFGHLSSRLLGSLATKCCFVATVSCTTVVKHSPALLKRDNFNCVQSQVRTVTYNITPQ